jgi:hypothetical protein
MNVLEDLGERFIVLRINKIELIVWWNKSLFSELLLSAGFAREWNKIEKQMSDFILRHVKTPKTVACNIKSWIC